MFSLSPSVDVKERDFSLTIKQLPASKTGFILRADTGEALKIVPITNESDLIRNFGYPTNLNYEDWFNVWNFLQYAQSAYVVRPMNPSAKNTAITFDIDTSNQLKIENTELGNMYNSDIAEKTLEGLAITQSLMFINRYVTSQQNLAVIVCSDKNGWNKPITSDTTQKFVPTLQSTDGSNLIKFSELFDYEPDWDAGEFIVLVAEKDEKTGLYDIAEKYIVSYKETGRDNYGRNIFVEHVFFTKSRKLYAKLGEEVKPISTYDKSIDELKLKIVSKDNVYPNNNASDLSQLKYTGIYEQADIDFAYELFANPEEFDLNILVAHKLDLNKASVICKTRKDCVAIISPYEYDEIVGKSSTEATEYLIKNYGTRSPDLSNAKFKEFNTYAAIFGNVKYQYDKFNDKNRWMPIGGDVAGLLAVTARDYDPWWATAGLFRGKIKNAIKLGFNPKKQNRDELYVNAINPIMSVPGEGVAIIWGNKTATARPSAMDRLNVRRLLITIEKAIATTAKYSLFEFNDEFTRARVKGMIEPYLREVKGRRGLYDFLVVCDETNNTPEIIDQNVLVIDIYIKPERVAEFIQINVNVTRTDANFQELIKGQVAV